MNVKELNIQRTMEINGEQAKFTARTRFWQRSLVGFEVQCLRANRETLTWFFDVLYSTEALVLGRKKVEELQTREIEAEQQLQERLA